ncbi:MAG TPA: hypothetical protein VGT00_08060 [Methylomirabilota bacterium]|nr:hypothetical protein [Methylomirabilota bacterium]
MIPKALLKTPRAARGLDARGDDTVLSMLLGLVAVLSPCDSTQPHEARAEKDMSPGAGWDFSKKLVKDEKGLIDRIEEHWRPVAEPA